MKKKNTQPTIDAVELETRRRHLLSLKLTEKAIAIIAKEKPDLYTVGEINDRFKNFYDLGFSNPATLINTSPTLLSLLPDRVRQSVEAFRPYVKDPVAFIESTPPLLTYSFEKNLEPKIKMLSRLVELYHLPYTATEIIRRNNAILTSKIDKLWVLARVLEKYAQSPTEVTHGAIGDLLFSNLEDVMNAVKEAEGRAVTLPDFIKEVKNVKKRNTSKEQKVETIDEMSFEAGSKEDKIHSRYWKGYRKDA